MNSNCYNFCPTCSLFVNVDLKNTNKPKLYQLMYLICDPKTLEIELNRPMVQRRDVDSFLFALVHWCY